MYYSKKVIKHFVSPKNFGKIKNADGAGKVGNARCGDLMKLYINVGKKAGENVIKDIKFHTLGCAAAIATSDMICDLAKGKTLKGALEIDNKKVFEELGGLPPIKIHCANLAEAGLKAAIKDYEQKKTKKIKKGESG